jgi:hypothetical protein
MFANGFKCFQVFFLQVFHTHVSSVSAVLYVDVSIVHLVLRRVFQMHVSCVSSAFRRMLQVLHSDVSKVDQVLHLCPRFSAASPSPPAVAAGRVHAREKRREHEQGLSTRSRVARALDRWARDGCAWGRWSAGTGVRALALP